MLIGGDVCPIGRSTSYFINGDAQSIFGDLLAEFEQASLTVVNLECPLIKEKSPILKEGPVLGAASECVKGLRDAPVDVVNLANNHIMDHGSTGLQNTISVCRAEGIACVGAGQNLAEARKVLIHQIRGIRIGILGVAEHEFSIATKDGCGANPLDVIDYVREVQEHRDQWDYLIVLLHGGNEYYAYPSPRLRKVCRFLVEQGANAVICQHSHCPGCYETYQRAYIVYGQGNLVFDNSRNEERSETWNQGFLVRLSIHDNLDSTMKIIPYVQCDKLPGAKRMDSIQEDSLIRKLEQRSRHIQDDGFVVLKWLEFCAGQRCQYLKRLLLPNSRLLAYLNRKYHLCDTFVFRKKRKLLLNLTRCESHRDILETIL